jgi:hypothetical protein
MPTDYSPFAELIDEDPDAYDDALAFIHDGIITPYTLEELQTAWRSLLAGVVAGQWTADEAAEDVRGIEAAIGILRNRDLTVGCTAEAWQALLATAA